MIISKYGFNKDDVLPNKTILGYPLIDIMKIGFTIPDDQKDKMPVEPELLDKISVTLKHQIHLFSKFGMIQF